MIRKGQKNLIPKMEVSRMFDLVPFKFGNFERSLWPEIWAEDWPLERFATFKTDITADDKAILIESELPGFTKEEITVAVDDNRLTISAQKDETKEEKKGEYIRKERRSGQMQRTFVLDGVTRDAVSAEFKDGILRLTLPKLEASEPKARRIEIN
jgi:HSP20 family protein